MIKVLIVDDETLARTYLREMLKDNADFQIVGESRNGREAVRDIREKNPDLVFLDVQMPEMDGFAVVEEIGAENLPQVVFVTAFEQYAIRAFEINALDYLLKPFDETRFVKTLERVKKEFSEEKKNGDKEQLEALLRHIKQPPRYLERFLIKSNGRILFLETNEIVWIEADDKYAHLHTVSARHLVRQTLGALESELDPSKFVRVNRSAIVNIRYIKEMQTLFNGELLLVMKNGAELRLNRNQKNQLFERLGKPV
jgi:Response regulator of the LytR/AlgR family